jgi:putative FmdB family regulatory protein
MPTYVYRCLACHNVFEKVHKMREPPPSHCPVCNGAEVKKLITNGQFILKGAGWYHDGYGSAPSIEEMVFEQADLSALFSKA